MKFLLYFCLAFACPKCKTGSFSIDKCHYYLVKAFVPLIKILLHEERPIYRSVHFTSVVAAPVCMLESLYTKYTLKGLVYLP